MGRSDLRAPPDWICERPARARTCYGEMATRAAGLLVLQAPALLVNGFSQVPVQPYPRMSFLCPDEDDAKAGLVYHPCPIPEEYLPTCSEPNKYKEMEEPPKGYSCVPMYIMNLGTPLACHAL